MKKDIKQFALYLIVGGLATIVEWVMFYLLNNLFALHYMVSTALAFIVSTFANWAFGKLILFHEKQKLLQELAKIYLTSIVGLLLNLGIMWLLVDVFSWREMLSKIIATGIVFFWNFFIRKFLIYKI